MEKISDIQIQEQRQAFASSRSVPNFVQRMKKGRLTRNNMQYSQSQNPNHLSSVLDYLSKKDDIECFLPNDAGLSELRLFDVNPLPPIPSNFLEGNRSRQLAGRHSQPAAFLTKRTRGRKRHSRQHVVASTEKLELVAKTLGSQHLRVPFTSPQLSGPMKPDGISSNRTNEPHYLNNTPMSPIKQMEKFERLPDNAFEMPDDRLSFLEQQSYVLHPNEADHKRHLSLAGSGGTSAESNIRKPKSRAHTHASRLSYSRSTSERRPGGSREQQLHAFQTDDERSAVIGFRPQATRTLAAATGSSSGEMVAAGGDWRTLANKGSAHESAAAAAAAGAGAEDNNAGGNVRRRESPEHLPYESPYHMPLETFLSLNGAVATLYPKSDMAAQITLLKSLLMPEFARELYVGRGLRLPETHHLVNPKLKEFAPLQPGVVPVQELAVQRNSNGQENAAPALKLDSGEENKKTSKPSLELHQNLVPRLVAVLRPIDGAGSDRQNAIHLPPLVGNAALPGRMSRSLSSQPERLKWGSPPLPDLTIPADSKGKELQVSSTPEAITSARLPPLDMSVVGHSPNRVELASTVSTSRLGPLPDTQRLLQSVPVGVSSPAAVAPPTEPIATTSRDSHEEPKKASTSASASGGARELSDLHQRILQVLSRDHSAVALAVRESSAVVARAPTHTPELNDGGIFGMRRSRSLLVSASATAPLARSKSLHDCDSGGSIRAAPNREEQPAQQVAASAYTDS